MTTALSDRFGQQFENVVFVGQILMQPPQGSFGRFDLLLEKIGHSRVHTKPNVGRRQRVRLAEKPDCIGVVPLAVTAVAEIGERPRSKVDRFIRDDWRQLSSYS